MAPGLVLSYSASSARGVPAALETPTAPVKHSSANNSDRAAHQLSTFESVPEVDRAATEWHLLVVDDDRDVRMMLRSLLELEGFTVGEAGDGLEGLARLRASRSPLIVLLDYKMPRMNGEEMLHAVRADPALMGRDAFIFVTANLLVFSPELLQVVHDAAIPVIQKPYALSTLLEEIDRAGAWLAGKGTGPAV